MYNRQSRWQKERAAAFYSSELGGVTTDPALMAIAVDEHGFHRGHAVFETIRLAGGYVYLLEQHLARLFAAMVRADIPLPPGTSPAQVARTVLETAAASCRLDGSIRVFACAGRGGFELAGTACETSSLYVVVSAAEPRLESAREAYMRGWRVKTSPVPAQAPYFASLKHVGCLPNALAQQDAEADGFHTAILLDERGFVLEGADCNVACLTEERVLVVPPFDATRAGTTATRLMRLLPAAVAEGIEGLVGVEQRPIAVQEAKACVEVMLLGAALPVMPVSRWDGDTIGDGVAGIVALQLRALMEDDADPESEFERPSSDEHVHLPVPYGMLTGMGW